MVNARPVKAALAMRSRSPARFNLGENLCLHLFHCPYNDTDVYQTDKKAIMKEVAGPTSMEETAWQEEWKDAWQSSRVADMA